MKAAGTGDVQNDLSGRTETHELRIADNSSHDHSPTTEQVE